MAKRGEHFGTEFKFKVVLELLREESSLVSRRVTVEVQNRGFNVGRKVVKKLRDMLGFRAIYTMPKTTF